jgi:hypothetical protein
VPSDFSNCALALKDKLVFDPPATVPQQQQQQQQRVVVSSEITSLIHREFIENDTIVQPRASPEPSTPLEPTSTDARVSLTQTIARVQELERIIATEAPLDSSAPELQSVWGVDLSEDDDDDGSISSHTTHSNGNGGDPSAVLTNADPTAHEPVVVTSGKLSLSKQYQVPVLGKRSRRAYQRFPDADSEAPSRKRR